MKVVLEAGRLARTQNYGGVDSYWHQLVPALLSEAGPEDCFVLLTAFLNPVRARALEPFRRQGAVLRHYWARPQWLERLARLGAPAEWFAGPHDLIHAVEPVWPFRGRARIVVTAHDLMYRHHPQFLDPRWVRRLQRGTAALAGRASFWICVSARTRDELVRAYGVPRGRTAVVHHGVDPAFRAAGDTLDAGQANGGPDGGRPYFLFLGSVEPKKNLEGLLRAFALAMGRGLEAGLTVAGRAGWGSEAVRRAAGGARGLREKVRFSGFVPHAQLPALVAGARALVLPSRWEGFGMPVLEAMAAGTPVLCSDRGALPEVAGGAARLLDPDDSEGLAEALLALDGDADLRAKMRAAGRERARGFTWARCARETLAAYRRALALPA